MIGSHPGPAAALLGECRKGCKRREEALQGEISGLIDELGQAIVSPASSVMGVARAKEAILACKAFDLRTPEELQGVKERLSQALLEIRSRTERMAGPFRVGNFLGDANGKTPTRPSCTECVEKHLGSAWALITETQNGYPHHMMAVGHLHEAEDESQEWPDLHQAIRDARKNYQQKDKMPDWAKLRGLLEKAKAS